MAKLDAKHIHIIKLTARDADKEGWAGVSEQLYPILTSVMPAELVTFEKTAEGGRMKLTKEGQAVLYAMDWLLS